MQQQLGENKVAYPKLTLYAFHRCYNLAQGMETPVEGANHLWLKCQELGGKLNIPKLETFTDFIKHQPPNLTGTIPFTAVAHQHHLHLRGEVNALQIDDTYVLDLTFRYPEPEVSISDLRGLNPHQYLLPKNINVSLGQTLVLFAKPLGDIENYQALADECLRGLLSDATIKELQIYCQSQSKLLGSPIFEYNNDANSPQEQCQILIWLNTHPQTNELEEQGDYYNHLIDVLNCRSKIIYTRWQAIWCNQKGREDFSKLEKKLMEFNQVKYLPTKTKLDKFQQWLNELPEISFSYSLYLRDLQIHKNTLQTNSRNLALYLNKFKNASLAEDDLGFLSSFLELASNTFIEQIDVDLGYLIPAQNLFEQMINAIRGLVETEQAQRERSLEQTIQVLGIGFGGGAIVSGVVTAEIDKINLPVVHKCPFISALFFSFIATLGFIILGCLITKCKER